MVTEATEEKKILTMSRDEEAMAPVNYENDDEQITDVTKEILLSQSPDDEGNAHSVNWLYYGKFLHCAALGWLYYNGQYWQRENAETMLDRATIETLITRRILAIKARKEFLVTATKPSSNNVKNTKYLFRSLVSISIDDFDSNPDLLNCANGVVNLKDGFVTSHNEHQRFTYCISTAYDSNTDDSEWADWIYNTIIPTGTDDDGKYIELATWIQMAVGYSLTGHTHEQCMFYLIGPPRAGKGVFLQTLDKLLGRPLSSGVDFDTFTAKRGKDSQNFDLAPLKSCRLITATESDRTSMLNAKRVKSITGNDPIYCAHKRKDFFTYTPQFKIWLASNFKIMASADDEALWSRLRIIEFPNSYLGCEDYALESKLWANKEGILKWAIDGAVAWNKRKNDGIGLGKPNIINVLIQEHRAENDTVQQFIDDSCVIGENHFIVGSQFTISYKNWCDENSIKPLGGRRLGEVMRRKGYDNKQKWIKNKNMKSWLGISLRIE